MNIACGVDLVYLPRFKKSLKSGGENFLRRIYHEQELNPRNHLRGVPQAGRQTSQPRLTAAQHHLGGESEISHLAGIFAAKEAIIKALSLPTDSWHDIFITYKRNGQPKAEIINLPAGKAGHKSLIINHSLSISHDATYVIAQFVAVIKE